jgi:hypothetical protein
MDPMRRACLTPRLADVMTRRGSLRLLTALLLVAASTEAAAADPLVRRVSGRAAQPQQGRHHQPEQKRKSRHRHHANKNKDKNKDKLEGVFRNIALTVQNADTDLHATASVRFFFAVKTGLDTYGNWMAASTVDLAPNQSFRYAPERFRVGALISFTPSLNLPQVFVDVRNLAFGFPKGGITYGGGLDPASGKIGTVLIPNDIFSTGGEERDHLRRDAIQEVVQCRSNCPIPNPSVVNRIDLELERKADSDNFIEFHLRAQISRQELSPG